MHRVIYAIECLPNGFTYVGLSSEYKRRWRQHRSELRRGVHATEKMIVDWRKYGESAFHVRVLEVLPHGTETREAEKAELRWQAHFARLGRVYNAPTCRFCGRLLYNPSDRAALDPAEAKSSVSPADTRGPPAKSKEPAKPPAHEPVPIVEPKREFKCL
jgi:hypothetical protein